MNIKKLAITASFLGLAACGQRYAEKGEPRCQNIGDGPEVVVPSDNSSSFGTETLFFMGDVYKQTDDYIWGEAKKPNGQAFPDFNVHLEDGKITSCMVGDQTYYPKPEGP